MTAKIVGTLQPSLERAEIERTKRKTNNLDAYDYYLRGLESFYRGTRNRLTEAQQLFCSAIELDREFASAYGMAAWCYLLRRNNNWMDDPAREVSHAGELARQAVRAGKDDATALSSGGFVLARLLDELSRGDALIGRSLAIDPNSAVAWQFSAWTKIYLGQPEAAIDHFARAMRLSPLDPILYGMQNGTAAAYFLAAQYGQAVSWAERALTEQPNYLAALRISAASHALAGHLSQAQAAMKRICQIDPALRLSDLGTLAPFRRPEDFTRYVEGLRIAGLPE
jgi:tetratricopeptide (TPR) repeat protein